MRTAVKFDNNFVDDYDIFFETSDPIDIGVLRTAIGKVCEVKKLNAEALVNVIYLLSFIEDFLIVEFEDKQDFKFEITKGNTGAQYFFDDVVISIFELLVIEINKEEIVV